MASVIDQRNIIVQKNIPKLIRNLTGFNSNEENFKLCVQLCYSRFKHHRYLTVNSHEVKRDVDGICEKLRFANFHDTEKKFKKLAEATVSHELAVNHYEKDVIYSILNLLTTLAYDPIGNLKTKLRSGQEVLPFKPLKSKTPRKASDTFISSLLKDNFKVQANETDSELSEWTDSDGDEPAYEESNSDDSNHSPPPILRSSLRPPEKPKVFGALKIENSEKWLRKNIQHSWWSNELTSLDGISSNPAANFCDLWQKHLREKSLGFIKLRPLSFISEYCLLREIFWMFVNPVDCKCFRFEGDDIVVRADVTLPSLMPETLCIFLSDILRSINLMHRMKADCKRSYQLPAMSHTLESYYKKIQNILDRIVDFILEEEATVKKQQETYTVVTLHNKFRAHAKMLEMLWSIHSSSVLDDTKYPPHICATYLLANLSHHIKTSCVKEKKNLALMLLVTCLKTYLEIFDVWWTEARLDDLKSEFLMERIHEDVFEEIQPRMFAKSREKSFYLNEEVSQRILGDSIISDMLNYSIKATFTLELISRLDRVHEMRQIANDSTSLYDEFVCEVDSEIRKFSQSQVKPDENEKNEKGNADKAMVKNQGLAEDIRAGMSAYGDELMLLAFQTTLERIVNVKPAAKPRRDLQDILNSASDFMLLPLEQSIQRIINELLIKKISIADHFVTNIYIHEFQVQQHLQEIRKVFFLESNDLISFFNLKLFPQIEAGDSSWASPYLLTLALNDAICSSRQNSSTLFSVEVNRRLGHHSVLEAINEITLCFNVSQNLSEIFSVTQIQKYNSVFRFLAKIKWTQKILANLFFPDFFKHRPPYVKLQMIDLVIKRLSLSRFAMQQTINSLHNHFMVMLQGLSYQLDGKIAKSQNISELILHHDSFVASFYEKSLQGDESAQLSGIIIEMLKLAKVLKDEWNLVTAFAALDATGNVDTAALESLNTNSIAIEKAFGVCEHRLKVLEV